jgi:hypothetical protein
VSEETRKLALSLISPAGSGSKEDIPIVLEELLKMPPQYLQLLKDKGVRVLVGRDNVVDVVPEFKGVTPRGWEGSGKTWDDAGGMFSIQKNAIIVTTTGHGQPGGPRISTKHGSDNLVLHEAFHAVEHHSPQHFKPGSDFMKAYEADLDLLSDYEKQAGVAGPSEAFAESAAEYFGNGEDSGQLGNFWAAESGYPPGLKTTPPPLPTTPPPLPRMTPPPLPRLTPPPIPGEPGLSIPKSLLEFLSSRTF